MHHTTRGASSAVLALALFGCGGGGGGDGNSGSTPPVQSPTSALSLTAANTDALAADVALAASDTVGVGGIGSSLITAAVVNTDERPSLTEIIRWSIGVLDDHEAQSVASLVSGAVVTDVVNCDSGSIGVAWNDADNDSAFSSGDSFTLTFNSCFADGINIDGTMGLQNLVLSGNPDVDIAWSISTLVTATALSLTDGAHSARVDGSLDVSITTDNGDDLSTVVRGSRLTYTENRAATTLTDFSYRYAEELSSGIYALTYDGKLTSSELDGYVTFETERTFRGVDIYNSWPLSGLLMIRGANRSTIWMEALGNDMVQLSTDSNGDGIVDYSVDTTWTTLASN